MQNTLETIDRAKFWQLAKAFIAMFVVCGLFWIPRIARKLHPTLFDPIFDWVNSEPCVLAEHFAAGLGIPAFFTACACIFVCRPWKPSVPNIKIRAELLVIFVAFMSALGYSVAESGHEAMQLTLAKPSNFGQFLADHCIPAQTIETFGACSKEYFGVIGLQLAADALGMLAFICILLVGLYRLKRSAPAS